MPTVRTGDIETYYERSGDGQPVVFVHASVLDHSQWDEQVAAVSDDHTAVAYDLRGHGRTGGSDISPYTIELFADDLHELVTELELYRPVICGHSMGGLVAQAYAVAHPGAVAGLVLADTWTPAIRGLDDWLVRRVMLNAAIPPAKLVGYQRVERAQVWVYERLFAGSSGKYDRIVALREAAPEMATGEFVKVIRAMTRRDGGSPALSAISAPTLVLYGADDLPFVKRHAAVLAAAISDVAVTEIPDAGHASNLDNPTVYTGALEEFLATTDRFAGQSPERSNDGDRAP